MPLCVVALWLVAGPAAHAGPVGTHRSALVDGRAVDAHPVSAVGALLAIADDGHATEGAFMCSAVLVEPTVALTAAHCVALVEADAADEGWQLDWWVSFDPDVRAFDGADPVLPPATVAARPVVHPRFDAGRPIRSDRPDAAHDIAVLLLAEPAPVAPVPMARAGVSDGSDAIDVLLAGYGMTAHAPDAETGRRMAGPGRLFAVGARELRVGRRAELGGPSPEGLAEKCGGDSGGPTFAVTADGWRVVGVTSRAFAGDPGCALAGLDTRVDAYAGWVDGVVRGDDGPAACAARPGRAPHPPIGLLAALLLLGRVTWGRRRGGVTA